MHRAFGGDRPAPPAEGYVSISLTAPEASQRLLRECATSRMVHVTRLLAIEGIDVNVKDARGRPAGRPHRERERRVPEARALRAGHEHEEVVVEVVVEPRRVRREL